MGKSNTSKKGATNQVVVSIKELETSISAGNVKAYNGIMELIDNTHRLVTDQVTQ